MITTEELYELYIKILKLNKNKKYYSIEAVECFIEKLIEKSKKILLTVRSRIDETVLRFIIIFR